jgi:hypothetical protein
VSFEIVSGRCLALCAHPVCAWHLGSMKARAVVVSAYFSAGYVGVILSLIMAR